MRRDRRQRFSKPPPSATRPPLRAGRIVLRTRRSRCQSRPATGAANARGDAPRNSRRHFARMGLATLPCRRMLEISPPAGPCKARHRAGGPPVRPSARADAPHPFSPVPGLRQPLDRPSGLAPRVADEARSMRTEVRGGVPARFGAAHHGTGVAARPAPASGGLSPPTSRGYMDHVAGPRTRCDTSALAGA